MMAHKRFIILILLVIASFGAIFATDSGLLEVQTDHFTIIYDKDTEESATVIAQCCEETYEYLVSVFKTDPDLHFPVVLTSDTKMLNANFAAYPANRIFLYDVVADKGSLTSFPETLAYVFRHELTHAFTCNFRSSFWQVLANIFADSITPSTFLYSFQSLTEGIAVTLESLDGYGRMNDYASTRLVRQAKIEGNFPTWLEICGARDTYPKSLLPYIFGGSFLTYLYDTYGSDKVCEIFVQFGKINWFKDATGVIEKIIGVKMDTLWTDFYESIEIPSNILTGSVVAGYTKQGVFTQTKALSDGSVMVKDSATYSLYKLSSDLTEGSKVLEDLSYAETFDISEDGLLLLPMLLEKSNSVQIKTQKGKVVKTFDYKDRDVRGGAFLKEGLVLYTSKAQETFLEVYDSSYSLLATVALGYGAVASGFAALGDGRLAFIYTNSASDNIAIFDTSTLSIELYENPISMRISGLALSYGTSEGVLSFEWYPTTATEEKDSPILGGYGEFNPEDGCFKLSKVAVNGGVNYPVRLKDMVVYVSSLYEGDILSSISIDQLCLEDYGITSSSAFVARTFDLDKLKALASAKKYNPFNHMSSGMFLPFGTYMDGTSGVGLTWSAMDPTETFGFNMAGFNTKTGFSVGLWGALNGSIGAVSLPISVGSLISEESVKLNVLVQPSYNFYFDAGKYITVSDTAYYTLSAEEDGVKHGLKNSLTLAYTNATSTGLGLNDTLGYQISFGLLNLDPNFSFKVSLPFYFPITLKGSVTYNIASKAFVTEGEGKLTLISIEVQDGTRLLGVYIKRVVVDAVYDCVYATEGEEAFTQTVTLRAYVEVAPLLGMLASSMNLKLGAQLVWNPAEGTPKFSFAVIQ